MIDAPGAAPSLPPWRVERILYDKEGYLLVDKPVGIPPHGGDESLAHSVVQRLGTWLSCQGRDPQLAVHQSLNQETSGVLLLVTQEATTAEALQAGSLERRYLAVVELSNASDPTSFPDEGRSELWLSHVGGRTSVEAGPSPSGKSRKRKAATAMSAKAGKARRALTFYKVLKKSGKRALVELRLETDRKHQIRATLAHLGAPILGDTLYGGAPAARLMLHAHSLSGGPLPQELKAPVPVAFTHALAADPIDQPAGPEMAELIGDAACLRQPLTSRTSAFRLVNGAGDGLPGLTVDAYGAFATLNLYDESLNGRAQEIAGLVHELGFAGVYLKQRVRSDLRTEDADELAPGQVLLGEAAPESYLVDEFGISINIELQDGLSTGLFVDMRDNRMKTRGWAASSRRGGQAQMLNLFCYTSSFSLAAAMSGAQTTNVDLSGRALERGRSNFSQNGLDPAEHRFFKEDAMKFLARSVKRKDRYDFIVLDPPSFATVGKGTFSVKNGYGQAAADCFRILAKGGRLLCVTNHTKTSPDAFRKIIQKAAESAGRKLRYTKSQSAGLDCPPHPSGPWPSKSVLIEVE